MIVSSYGKFSLAKLLGLSEENLDSTAKANMERQDAEEAKLNADITEMKARLSPEELAVLRESLDEELLKPPTMPTHGINY